MKLNIYHSRYIIAIGMLMVLCFSGIVWFVSGRLKTQTERISIDAATRTFQLTSSVVKNEFESFSQGLIHAGIVVDQFKSAEDFLRNSSLVEAQLLSRPQIDHAWYAVQTKDSTRFQVVSKIGGAYIHATPTELQRRIMKKLSAESLSSISQSSVVTIGRSTHWLMYSGHRLPDGSNVLLVLDVDLNQLQEYLQSFNSAGRASAAIIDEEGTYITGPEQHLIGSKIEGVPPAYARLARLADSVTTYEVANSNYLNVPVMRYYTPLALLGANWTMVVETPTFIVNEEAEIINQYIKVFFLLTALITLVLIAWSQTKWRKEFMLRQAVEMKEKQLSIEKNELSLIAERQQKENALLQLNVLKEKVDPHFLFNSLSSLNALIDQDQEVAKSFVLKLSKVYRYVLESYPNGLAPVEEELNFVREYFFLLKIRFGDGLEPLHIDVSPELLRCKVPFMSLQTLIENAVKHNIVSREKRLQIRVYSDGIAIVVSNNLQPRQASPESGKQGLKYLKSTYAFFNNHGLRYGPQGDAYVCYLPIII